MINAVKIIFLLIVATTSRDLTTAEVITVTQEEVKQKIENFVPGKPLNEIDFEKGQNLSSVPPDEILVQAMNGTFDTNEVILEAALSYVKWPNGVLPYLIDTNFAADERAVIASGITEMQAKTCVRYVSRTTEKNYVMITKGASGSGCYAYIGVIGGAQVINLERACLFYGGGSTSFIGTFLHESMHTLGFIHEHSRSDRDNYVIINFSNIIPAYTSQFTTISGSPNELTTYDFGSLMHYPPRAFAIDGTKNTITAKDGKTYNMGQRVGFSTNDITRINLLYCVATTTPTPTTTTTRTTTTPASTPCGSTTAFEKCLQSPTFGCVCFTRIKTPWSGATQACALQGFRVVTTPSANFRIFIATQLLAGRTQENYWINQSFSFFFFRFHYAFSGPWRIRGANYFFTVIQNRSTFNRVLCVR